MMNTTTTETYTKRKRRATSLHARENAALALFPITMQEDAVIAEALVILERRLVRGCALSSPGAVRDYLRVLLAQKPHEEFVVIFLDAQNHVIAAETLFRGTLTQTSVYPREVVKTALAHNAAAIVCAHNHPSGECSPSRADETLTATLKRALALVDVAVLDHFIVAGTQIMSFAERGIL